MKRDAEYGRIPSQLLAGAHRMDTGAVDPDRHMRAEPEANREFDRGCGLASARRANEGKGAGFTRLDLERRRYRDAAREFALQSDFLVPDFAGIGGLGGPCGRGQFSRERAGKSRFHEAGFERAPWSASLLRFVIRGPGCARCITARRREASCDGFRPFPMAAIRRMGPGVYRLRPKVPTRKMISSRPRCGTIGRGPRIEQHGVRTDTPGGLLQRRRVRC